RRIRGEPLPLFPRAMAAAIAAGGRGETFDRGAALKDLEKSIAAGAAWSPGSSGAFAYEILWRSGLPAAGHILDLGLEAYRPIFGAIERPATIDAIGARLESA